MDRLRTFGIVAHIDAGKTTLTERILFSAGAQTWVGSVDEGTASMDWMAAERERGISITAAATRVQWGGHVLQVVDTPGHVDFTVEVERCLWVLDGVVVVVDAVRGVESQTEAVWHQATERGVPRLVFVNKLDRHGADFAAALAEIGERLDCRPLPVVVPLLDDQGTFAGLGDAVTGAVQWFEGRPSAATMARLGTELLAANERLVEAAADGDDEILAAVLAGQAIAPERLRATLRAGFLAGRLVPVLAGAALWNRGVDWLLDAVVCYLPGPLERGRQGLWSLERAGDPTAPFCGFVFKVQHVDEAWNFVRVVRGRLLPGSAWVRGRAPGTPRLVDRVWSVQADRHRDVAEAGPGEIVVVPGEAGLRTGDTICAPGAPVALPVPRFPAPVLAVTFEPARAEDGSRLWQAVRELAVDDPTLRVDRDQDRILVRGMGELHLEIFADLVRQRVGVEFSTGRPRVDRHETVRHEATAMAEAHAVVAGVPRWARCAVRVKPSPGEEPAAVTSTLTGPGAEAALAELQVRAAAGQRVGGLVGAEVELAAVEADPAGLLEPLLQTAASKAFDQVLQAAGVVELEPQVQFEVRCPEESAPAVMADLAARDGRVDRVSSGRLGAIIHGHASLGSMLGYVTRLRSITRGLGKVSMRPAGLGAMSAVER
jgi:elongation factor G